MLGGLDVHVMLGGWIVYVHVMLELGIMLGVGYTCNVGLDTCHVGG